MLPILGQRGLAVDSGEDARGAPGPTANSHLQDHDDVGLFFEGIHTLDQLGVVEAVHYADLLPDILLLFGGIRLEELPCPDFSSFLFYKSKDLSKFPAANERRRRKKANLAKLSTKLGLTSDGLQEKSSPPLFINTMLVERRHAHVCAYRPWLLLRSTQTSALHHPALY